MFFENFIITCLEHYGLDPCHYFGSPGLSWDATVKMTGIELKLILNIDMYLFVEKGMRGDVSYIARRFSKANNKYLKSYDNTVVSKANILHIWMEITYMVGQSINIFLTVNLSS